MNLKKELSGVAEVVAQIMGEQLKGQQHKIDKNKNNKIDAHDFAILRGEKKAVKKEEVEQIDELVGKGKLPAIASYHKQKSAEAKDKMETVRNTNTKLPVPKATSAKIYAKDAEAKYHSTQAKRASALMKKEEVEQIDEMGYSATAARAGKDIGKPGKMFGKIAASAAKRYGSEEKGKAVAGAVLKKLRMKEEIEITDEQADQLVDAYDHDEKNAMTFSEMLAAYKEQGISVIAEEPTEDQFNAEIKDQMASFLGKKKQPKVSTPATKGVKDMPEEVETKQEVIEERSLTEPEMKKKEEIVKSMKKKMPGFKERYGERAKSVMYATATKIAKKD